MKTKRFHLTVPLVLAVLTIVIASQFSTSNGQNAAATHTIFMNLIEVKGATDKLAPPIINPKDLSKGYGYTAPGKVDKNNSQKWQVASYMFSPSFIAARQGDTIRLVAFVVNGDKHEIWITDPDGKKVITNIVWNRGKQYEVSFVAQKAGTYELICSDHAPTMTATILVLPR